MFLKEIPSIPQKKNKKINMVKKKKKTNKQESLVAGRFLVESGDLILTWFCLECTADVLRLEKWPINVVCSLTFS